MIKSKRQIVMILIAIVCFCALTGCTAELTPKQLMNQVTENLSKIESVSNSMKMEVELESVLDTMKISMDMEMRSTKTPQASHAFGAATVEMNDTRVASDIEIYQIQEESSFVTYSRMYDAWTKETVASTEKGNQTFQTNIFQEAGNSIKTFTLAKQKVTVNGKSCYEIYGDISGEELLTFMGLDMMQVFGMVELPDKNAIMEEEIPVIIDVYEEELLPARVIVDMTDVMNDLYDKHRKATNVNDFTIKLGYTGFNKVSSIQVPIDVQESVQ